MKARRFIMIISAPLSLACAARADLSVDCFHDSSSSTSVGLLSALLPHSDPPSDRREPVNVANATVRGTASLLWGGVGMELGSSLAFRWGGVGYDLGPLPSGPTHHTEGAVRQLPAGPGSAALLLSALLTVGGWHLTRASVGNLKLAGVPDWVHAEGRTQVGHAVSFDFDFTPLPPCCFEQPAGQRPFLHRVRREHAPRRDSQSFLSCVSVRGPPLVVST